MSNGGLQASDANFKSKLILLLAFAVPFGWLFVWPMASNQVIAFRDASNFFYPLFEWQCGEWGSGKVPLWNPLDQLGIPVLADATSSVLYPGKLVFALPLSFPLRFNLYIAGHVVLAAWNVYFLCRRWRCSPHSSALAAIGYAFGGHVVFQYSNVVFLVSAAWLPLAIYLADAMFDERQWRRAFQLGAVWAMMVLGGDPQTAYHSALFAMVQCFLVGRGGGYRPSPALPRGFGARILVRRAPLVALAGMSGVLLAAGQILPSLEWASRSQRGMDVEPRDIYQAIRVLTVGSERDDGDRPTMRHALYELVANPRPETHAANTYGFSLGPWRLAELVWPNFGGRQFPIHRRWLSGIPAEGKVWTPSLYCGVVTLIGAIAVCRRRSNNRWRYTSIAMLAIGILASFGWYGLGWMIQEIVAWWRGNGPGSRVPGHPVGGLYWFFVTVLPGYSYFRYPAKWFVFASLGLCVLAAQGMDQFASESNRMRRIASALAIASGIAALTGIAARAPLVRLMQSIPASVLWGPLDTAGAWRDLMWAFGQTATASMAVFLVVRFCATSRKMTGYCLLLLISALDLAIANHWLVARLPVQAIARIDEPPPWPPLPGTSGSRLIHLENGSSAVWNRPTWRLESSSNRLNEITQWERESLLHKFHLQQNQASFDSISTFVPAEIDQLWHLIARRGMTSRSSTELLGALGVHRILRPAEQETERGRQFSASNSPAEQQVVVIANSAEVLPKAWIVHDARFVADAASNASQFERAWFSEDGRFLDPRTTVVVDEVPITPVLEHPANPAEEACQVVRNESQCVIVEARLAAPGLLVVHDLFDRGWRAEVFDQNANTSQESPILRVNGLVRGVPLPAGAYRITMRYLPGNWILAGIVSVGAWVVWLWTQLRPRRLQ